MMIEVEDHPLLRPNAFQTAFRAPIAGITSPDWLIDLLRMGSTPPVSAPSSAKDIVRSMLRAHGYKPSGRGKPASEYLLQAAHSGQLDSINLPVDLCNAVSLHSRLPISVVDVDRISEPLTIALPDAGSSYVFNQAGQEIRLDGLPCLIDATGPCANAVRDSQRTKTSDTTTRTLTVIWGSRELGDHVEATAAWYRSLVERTGAMTVDVELTR